MQETIIRNLDPYLPEAIIKDAPSDKLQDTVAKQNSIWFPEYARKKTDEEIRQMIENEGGMKEEQDKDGKTYFVWKPKGWYAKVIKGKSEADLFDKIKKKYTETQRSRAYVAKTVADVVQQIEQSRKEVDAAGNKIGREINLEELLEPIDARGVMDRTGKLDWFRNMIKPYCTGDWEIYRHPAAEAMGLLIFRNKTNYQQIDVIKVSTSYLAYNRHIGGKDRNTLVGAFAPDIAENSNGKSLMLNAYTGNIELIEAM